jgi:glucoamylase
MAEQMRKSVEENDSTQPEKPAPAPGRPGAKPHWSSGAKTAVGTSVASDSRIWFTIGDGTLNEIYHPDIDKANTRSIRFLVTDGETFLSDEKVDATHEVIALGDGVPGYVIHSTSRQRKYRITKEIACDPLRDCLLASVRFEPSSPLQLYLLVDPQIADQGSENDAWIGAYKDIPMLFAGHRNVSMAAVCSVPFVQATCGFVGKSDGLMDLQEHRRLTRHYNSATNGNVTLLAEVDWRPTGGEFVLSIAFGKRPSEAAQQARAGVLQRFGEVRAGFVDQWEKKQKCHLEIAAPEGQSSNLYRVSTAVLQTHESKRFPGGFVASLSIPWGFSRGDKDIGGYHVAWPRDLVEAAMGKLACGDAEAARRALFYLACTQETAGSWCQNMWLDGTPHWDAEQMDGISLPILLADRLRREHALGDFNPWNMIRSAALFLVKNEPGTQQERWEAVSGFSVFTMACEVAALLAAAEFADLANERQLAEFLRITADAWNDAIDDYTYVQDTDLAKKHGIDGYYIRIAPPEVIEDRSLKRLRIKLPNHMLGNSSRRAIDIVSPDALGLVRFGLRAPHDPRILQTVRLLDATLRRETKTGPGWVRSTYDGYGEHADGAPFNGRGIGRCWPLLAGERGHYELDAGNRKDAEQLLQTMAAQSSECGMIPEQVWDAPDLPEHELFNGRPTGSGMPLAWAHAEYIKLMRSLQDGKVWDMPPQPVQRYQVERRSSPIQIWTEREPREWVTTGKQLRVDLCAVAKICWAVDSEGLSQPITTKPVTIGLHSVVLPLPEHQAWETLQISIEQGGKIRRLTLRSR